LSRSQRLLHLLQLLRSHRYPVTGAKLAETLGVSLRTLYRDIGTLQQQGADIVGEAGLGYVLRPGFLLPPLMFSEEEIEALVLGSRWVAERADSRLGDAARSALDRISAVLPDALRATLDASGLLIGPGASLSAEDSLLLQLRQGIRNERVIEIDYRDLKNTLSSRRLWPFALGFFDQVCLLVAWCELRGEFRNFRVDRIGSLVITEQRYPRRRQALMKAWRRSQGLSS